MTAPDSVQANGSGPVVIENCAIATMDGPRYDESGTEYHRGHIVVAGARIAALGEGHWTPAGGATDRARRINGTGCLATPGLINTHTHAAMSLFRGIADDRGRIMVVMTHNTDFGDTWERESESHEFFEQFSPKGYALGIDVLLYAMTH